MKLGCLSAKIMMDRPAPGIVKFREVPLTALVATPSAEQGGITPQHSTTAPALCCGWSRVNNNNNTPPSQHAAHSYWVDSF